MTLGFSTLFLRAASQGNAFRFLAIVCGTLVFAANTFAIQTKVDSTTVKAKSDSAHIKLDSVKAVPDSGKAKVDTTHAPQIHFGILSPWKNFSTCRDGLESAAECWRRDNYLVNRDIGFPGSRGVTLSLTDFKKVSVQSPFYSGLDHSPYLNGGLAPPENFALQTIGGHPQNLEEIWTPVIPIDTPITRLDWERGPLVLNVFDLRLRRMLSDRVYFGLDYYSTTADSQTYDYQFNVHQPYLGGLGFLGQIYHPIDRDSASLALEGLSPKIQAVAIRPRVGVWLDSNRILETYFDHLKNSSTLTLPQGPNTLEGVNHPGGADSLQALIPSSFSLNTEGLIYGETHSAWTLQSDISHSSIDRMEFRSLDSASRSIGSVSSSYSLDPIRAEIFRLRARTLATALLFSPFAEIESRSESWEGDSNLAFKKIQSSGWLDNEKLHIGFSPCIKFGEDSSKGSGSKSGSDFLSSQADAALERSSRMDDQTYWLQSYGGEANLLLPFRFKVGGGISSVMEDPNWEILYRYNPARFYYGNPDLKPRTDKAIHSDLAWSFGRFKINGGVDLSQTEDIWLPKVLPSIDSADTSGQLADSLALGLRNYSSQDLQGWHLGLGFGLGNWSLDLHNHFILTRDISDPGLTKSIADLSIPRRVFKGHLAWKRSLVENKLKVELDWDWEWTSTRYAWVPDLQGHSQVRKLDEYLALDFQAAMKIKTFTLFFRSKNMNHDRYATEPGVHPPGINFRFGVDWVLFN